MEHCPVEAVHTAIPFDGVAQLLQPGPQKLALLSGWQIPEQLWVPLPHMPLHAMVLAMQAPLHSFAPGQAGTQASPSHDTVPPPLGAVHGEHDVLSFGPQVATALLSTHLPEQT